MLNLKLTLTGLKIRSGFPSSIPLTGNVLHFVQSDSRGGGGGGAIVPCGVGGLRDHLGGI